MLAEKQGRWEHHLLNMYYFSTGVVVVQKKDWTRKPPNTHNSYIGESLVYPSLKCDIQPHIHQWISAACSAVGAAHTKVDLIYNPIRRMMLHRCYGIVARSRHFYPGGEPALLPS